MSGGGDRGPIEAIVIGGSAGAVGALKAILPGAPGDLPVLVVVHVPANRTNHLVEALQPGVERTLKVAEDKEALAPGTIYFAPAGYHLLVEVDRSCALSVDEPVHHSRPSIDVLFESAAEVFRERLLGMVLTGASADGAAGLAAIGRAGGVTAVQEPGTAEVATMPEAAIATRAPDHVLGPEELRELLRSVGATNGRRPG